MHLLPVLMVCLGTHFSKGAGAVPQGCGCCPALTARSDPAASLPCCEVCGTLVVVKTTTQNNTSTSVI